MQNRAIRALEALFGAMFLAFFGMGVSGWSPPEVPPDAEVFRQALYDSGYVFPLIYVVYLFVGLSWLTDLYAALTTVILVPVSLHIVLYHIALVPETIHLTLIVAGPNAFMLWVCRDSYQPLFRPRRLQRATSPR